MAASPVTPIPGLVSSVNIGGTAVTVVGALPNGGYIYNPSNAADQNIPTAESIFVDPVNPAILGGYGTTVEIVPGGSYELIPGQTTSTSVNAATSGHRFAVVSY